MNIYLQFAMQISISISISGCIENDDKHDVSATESSLFFTGIGFMMQGRYAQYRELRCIVAQMAMQ